MKSADDPRALTLGWDLPHAPANVWRALTEPALLARWLMESDLKPAVGQRFTFRQEPTRWWDGVVRCEVLELEQHRKIRYSWRSGAGESGLDTVVGWTLTPTPSGGTRLDLEQAGFSPKNAFALDGAKKGWERMVGALDALLATLPDAGN